MRAQTFADFEIVAVDDGSADASIEVLRRHGDAVKVLRQERRGPSAARNRGVANSTGEYLGFLDADDWWKPEFLAKMVAALERDRECVMAYCDLQLVDSLGKPFPTSLMAVRENRSPTMQDMLDALGPIMPSGVVIRRSVLDTVGGYPEPLYAFEDVYLWLLLREKGPFAYLNEELVCWRFAHFPAPLKAPGGQEAAGRIFRQMVMARYRVDPLRHVHARERAPRSILGYIGLDALKRGDPRDRAQRVSARHQPRSLSRAKLPAAGKNGAPHHHGARAERQIGQSCVSGNVDSQKRLLPDFIAIGPPRTATTWLHEVLQDRVVLPTNIKETDFFTRFYDRGLEWYADYFLRPDRDGARPVGEIDPMYFASPQARERIATDLPGCKIIVSFRDPVARAYSNYRLLQRITTTKADFERAATSRGDLVESSRYGTHLESWLGTFGRDRVLVLIYDDLGVESARLPRHGLRFHRHRALCGFRVARRRRKSEYGQHLNRRVRASRESRATWSDGSRRGSTIAPARLLRESRIIKFSARRRRAVFRRSPMRSPIGCANTIVPRLKKLELLTGRDLSAWKIGRNGSHSEQTASEMRR